MKKILLVDDNPDHTFLIKGELEDASVENEVVLARDGQEAIDYLQKVNTNDKVQNKLDLIVLDLNLPKVHGMDVLKLIRRNLYYRSIPVIVMSTDSDFETIAEVYKNGASDFVPKTASYEREFVRNIKLLNEYWLNKDKSTQAEYSVFKARNNAKIAGKWRKSLKDTVERVKKVKDITRETSGETLEQQSEEINLER